MSHRPNRVTCSPEGVRQSGRLFPRTGFVPVDHGFSQGDHRRPEIPHPLVLRFHRFLVVRRRSGFVVAGRPMGGRGKPDGEGGGDKKNARICEWDGHQKASVRYV